MRKLFLPPARVAYLALATELNVVLHVEVAMTGIHKEFIRRVVQMGDVDELEPSPMAKFSFRLLNAVVGIETSKY